MLLFTFHTKATNIYLSGGEADLSRGLSPRELVWGPPAPREFLCFSRGLSNVFKGCGHGHEATGTALAAG